MSLQYRKNIYICENGHQLRTVDRDAGVTPFLTKCLECGEFTRSQVYRVPQDITPTHEWYRPSSAEQAELPSGTLEHVEMGGLLLRKIES